MNKDEKSTEGKVDEAAEGKDEEPQTDPDAVPTETVEEPPAVEAPTEPSKTDKDIEEIKKAILTTHDNIKVLADGVKEANVKVTEYEQRLDNMEQIVVKLGEGIKSIASGSIGPGGQSEGQQGYNTLVQKLGPLAAPVMKAITPADPYAELGKAIINAKIKELAGEGPANPYEQIGMKVTERIMGQGIDNLLSGGQSIYEKEFLKEKAKQDARRTKETPPG